MALDAHSPADRVEQLITLTDKLHDMVVRETQLLDERRTDEAMALQEHVMELGEHYRRECARVKNQPDLITPAPDARRAHLRERTAALHVALDRHERALDVVRSLSEGLVRSVADFVSDTRAKQSAYGPSAAVSPTDAGAAITLNKRI